MKNALYSHLTTYVKHKVHINFTLLLLLRFRCRLIQLPLLKQLRRFFSAEFQAVQVLRRTLRCVSQKTVLGTPYTGHPFLNKT